MFVLQDKKTTTIAPVTNRLHLQCRVPSPKIDQHNHRPQPSKTPYQLRKKMTTAISPVTNHLYLQRSALKLKTERHYHRPQPSKTLFWLQEKKITTTPPVTNRPYLQRITSPPKIKRHRHRPQPLTLIQTRTHHLTGCSSNKSTSSRATMLSNHSYYIIYLKTPQHLVTFMTMLCKRYSTGRLSIPRGRLFIAY